MLVSCTGRAATPSACKQSNKTYERMCYLHKQNRVSWNGDTQRRMIYKDYQVTSPPVDAA